MLESSSVLPRRAAVEFLHNLLQNFQHESWSSVRVYNKKIGEEIPDWVEVFSLKINSEEDLKKLAMKGDLTAIKQLLDNHFSDNKFSFKVSIKNNKLNILFESEDVSDEDKLSELIGSYLNSFQINNINHLKIYAKKNGEDFPEWQKDVELKSCKNMEQEGLINEIQLSNIIYQTLDVSCYKHLLQKVDLEKNKSVHEIAEDFIEDLEEFLENDLEQACEEIIKVFQQFNLSFNKEDIKVIFNKSKEDTWSKIHSFIRDLQRVTREVINTDFPEETDALKAFFSGATAELAGGLNGKSLTREAMIGASLGALAGPLGSIVGGAIGSWIGGNNQQKMLEALLEKYQKARDNIFDEWQLLLEKIYIQIRLYLGKMASINIINYKEMSQSINYLLEGNNLLDESPEQAIDLFEKALNLNHGLVMAWNNKAWAYNAIEKFEESMIASQQAMNLDPEFELPP